MHLQKSNVLLLQLFVSGSHLSTQFGKTERDIVADGFAPVERLPILVDDDSGLGSALTAGLAVQMMAGALQRNSTDLLVLTGDRYEILAAALAATCLGVPIAHIHGGERTDGALDDACRHAITKLSSLHFVSTDVYRARVIQMGEPTERVFKVGAPLLDQVMAMGLLTEHDLADHLGLRIVHPVALVAYHPATREPSDASQVCHALLEGVAAQCKTIVLTAPNNDPGYQAILDEMKAFAGTHENTELFTNLGSQVFLSIMSHADVMIGNSSSGIHEAASFRLPVVNVGLRQASRLRPRNVLDCESEAAPIRKALSVALSSEFRESLADLQNPYGDGHAGERIVACLERFVPFKETILYKSFYDGPAVQAACLEWDRQHG
jgi:UDP-hydrolysing UDP-N-acetyl-D-glucosamine 2-epimerase